MVSVSTPVSNGSIVPVAMVFESPCISDSRFSSSRFGCSPQARNPMLSAFFYNYKMISSGCFRLVFGCYAGRAAAERGTSA